MKIDIITLHAVKNYGSVLQALATQKLFEEAGFQVSIINYIKEESRNENLMEYWAGNNLLKKIVIAPTMIRWRTVFDEFCNKYLKLTKKQYTSEKDFVDYKLEADVFCTGSDQVWNSIWNNGVLRPLYLSFVPDNKFKIAFSASFGQDRLPDDEIVKTQELINGYKMISVREESAVTILKEQYNFEGAVHLLDPTLCLPASFWRDFGSKKKEKKGYILVYNLNRSKEFDRYAVRLAHKTGLKLVRICTRYDQFLRPGKSILIPEIKRFISLIDCADFVLTDSFHATAFSMNMNTEPICVLPPKFGDRLESFLSLTGSTHRIIKDYNDLDVVNRPVDFAAVNEVLDSERNRARQFIDKVRFMVQMSQSI